MSYSIRKLALSLLMVSLMLGSTVAMTGTVAAGNAAIDYEADSAPQAQVVGDVTIADHRMGDDPLQYNDNNGEWTTLPGNVNDSVDNPYEFTATDINFSDAGAFPHAKDDVSALTASEWSTSGANASKLSVSDVETAPGVSAVSIATDGTMASGDTATATFSNFSITSEENKRYLQLALDVGTLDAGTTVTVNVVDSDGDYYTAEINTSRSSGEDFITNATGDGIVYQRQLGEMSMTTVGDGTFNDIEKVEVTAADGDFTGEISALNLDKMSKWDLGEEKYQADDDDELETRDIHEVKTGGPIAIHDLSTMGSTFSDARIKGLTVPFEQPLSALDSDDVNVSFNSADKYENYENRFDGYFRFHLPDEYDLSYANLQLEDTQSLPDNRYVTVEYAEGTGDTEFADIDSWNDKTSSYSSMGANITLDSTLQPGTSVVVHYDYVVSSSETSELKATSGVTGPTGDDDKGILGSIWAKIIGFFAAAGTIGSKLMGKW